MFDKPTVKIDTSIHQEYCGKLWLGEMKMLSGWGE